MKILLISLQKLGDVIHSFPLIQGVKSKYPSASISLLINDEAAGAAELISDIDNIYLFPRKKLQFLLSNQINSISTPYYNLKTFIEKINNQNFDLVINMTFTTLSAKILDLLHSSNKIGISYKNSQTQTKNNAWFRYLNELASSNKQPLFLYQDCLSKALNIPIKENLTKSADINLKNKKIVFQLTSADPRKQLDLNIWNQVFYNLIHNYNISKNQISILSSENEYQELKAFFDVNVINCNLKQAYDLINDSHLFFSVDTSLSHVAALTATDQIVFNLGPAQPNKISPYKTNVIHVIPKINCYPCSHFKGCSQVTTLCHQALDIFELTEFIYSKTNSIKNDKALSQFEILKSFKDNFGIYLSTPDSVLRAKIENKRYQLSNNLNQNIPIKNLTEVTL